ncbi:hypothetical protein Sru01_17430 [Sphaerisporangium rufum]|uniref:Uncharacterized protein n=1 Tax=Sphaerisporangium rufum TaxID=1381558 RepID=A0A919QZ38_9ACTN|nr:hypothetical protein [Sphaerisporangium rufum]GII76761.1 hypothetical protein Sru01_17430 [Sphaerisporangium rufum]
MLADRAFILDAGVLMEVARGDAGVIHLLQGMDAAGIGLVVPALAVTGAALDIGARDEQMALIRGVARLESAALAGVVTFDDATDLAHGRRAARSLEELWDVQAALQAVMRGCPVLTTDHARWKEASREVRGLNVVEIAELDT